MQIRRILTGLSYTAEIARLAGGRRGRLRNALVTLELIARHRLGLPGALRRLEVEEAGVWLALLVEDIGDVHAVSEVFAERTYALPPEADELLRRPLAIADLGSHVGASVAWFRARYPEARIVGFEPNPRSFRKLARSASRWPGVDVQRLAVADASGRRRLSVPPGRDIAASLASTPAAEPTEVDCVTLTEGCARARLDRIDLLKLDVEGSELEVLRAFERLDRVRVVVGEFHPALAGERAELEAALPGFDVRWTEQPKGDPLFVALNRRVGARFDRPGARAPSGRPGPRQPERASP